MVSRKLFIALSTAILTMSLSCPVSAQADTQDVAKAREAARGLAEKGLDLVDRGKYTEAIDSFKSAEEKFHAPTHLLFIARAYAKLGKLLDAKTTYQKVVDEQLANYAPDAFREAQAEARKEVEALSKRIPNLTISITGATTGVRSVEVDGKPVDWTKGPIDVDPGEHFVTVTAEGRIDGPKSVRIAEGADERVEFVVQGNAAALNSLGPVKKEAPTNETKGSLMPAIIGLSVGGAGLVLGAVTGGMSLGKVSDLKEQCRSNKQCPASAKETADSAKVLGNVSTAGFVIGGVGVAAGVVLFFLRPGKVDTPKTGVTLYPVIGFDRAGIGGSF